MKNLRQAYQRSNAFKADERPATFSMNKKSIYRNISLSRIAVLHLKVYIFAFFVLITLSIQNCYCHADNQFREILIDPYFDDLIRSNLEFMASGGVQLLHSVDGCQAIVSIAIVHQPQGQKESPQQLVLKGSVVARAGIVESLFGVGVESKRHSSTIYRDGSSPNKSILDSETLQKIKTTSKAEIELLPLIGIWKSKDGLIIYTAVGKLLESCDSANSIKSNMHYDPLKDLKILDAQEPFLSLLKTSPLLCLYGGAKGFEIDSQRRFMLAVGCAPIKGSFDHAKKIARLKAIRALLAQSDGIIVSQVQEIKDQEDLHLIQNGIAQHWLLSDFWSVQKQQVEGKIHSLPEVAILVNSKFDTLYVAIGN